MKNKFLQFKPILFVLFLMIQNICASAQTKAFFNPDNNGNDAWLQQSNYNIPHSNTDFTMEAWINPNTINTGAHTQTILATEHNDF